jgi:hypothetical protein
MATICRASLNIAAPESHYLHGRGTSRTVKRFEPSREELMSRSTERGEKREKAMRMSSTRRCTLGAHGAASLRSSTRTHCKTRPLTVRIPNSGIRQRKTSQRLRTNPLNLMAERTGLEPATPGVTGRYSDQLNYRSATLASPRGFEPLLQP